MTDGERYTAYCGLYCRDCIPSDHPLFAVAQELDEALTACRFDLYAELKREAAPVFGEYAAFVSVLRALRGLECLAPCAAGGKCKAVCAARDCVLARGARGCWECDQRAECPHLARLKRIHPHLAEHHELIRRHGLAAWPEFRKSHYAWETAAGRPITARR